MHRALASGRRAPPRAHAQGEQARADKSQRDRHYTSLWESTSTRSAHRPQVDPAPGEQERDVQEEVSALFVSRRGAEPLTLGCARQVWTFASRRVLARAQCPSLDRLIFTIPPSVRHSQDIAACARLRLLAQVPKDLWCLQRNLRRIRR